MFTNKAHGSRLTDCFLPVQVHFVCLLSAYEEHQKPNETKALQNPATCLNCAARTAYQLCDTNFISFKSFKVSIPLFIFKT